MQNERSVNRRTLQRRTTLTRVAGLVLLSACTGQIEEGRFTGGSDQGAPDATADVTARCADGKLRCAFGCVDTQSDPRACGSCEQACAAAELCDQGTCKSQSEGCSAGLTPCGGSCVDASSNAAHCGECNNACGDDTTCTNGRCECPVAQLSCDGSCVDPLSDDAHCGACDAPCAAGESCVGGECTCPPERTQCGESCIATAVDPSHCGACDRVCVLGQTCESGECVGAPGDAADQCGGSAREVTITDVSAYQSVELGLVRAGAAVDAEQRNADLVALRTTLFRVAVQTTAEFTPRVLSARVTLETASGTTTHFDKKLINGDSSQTDLDTTFQVLVPGSDMAPGSGYVVELVECEPTSGSVRSPRYPATGSAELGVRATGPLKVHFLPIQANSRLPDTSSATLEVYRQYLGSMYPASEVEFSVGDAISTSYPIDWIGVLDQVQAQRRADRPAADVYYYGLLQPAATFQEFCAGSCTSGIGFVADANAASQRAAVGVSFGNTLSAEVLAHELGHNHGREHAPCALGGSINGVDGSYPYADGLTGVWGYDQVTELLLDPEGHTDIMGYCRNKWISDYTYRALATRITQVNAATEMRIDGSRLAAWRVLWLEHGQPRWGTPMLDPIAPYGRPEAAEVLDRDGQAIAQVEVHRTRVADQDAAMLLVPPPSASWYAIRVTGAPAHPFVTVSP